MKRLIILATLIVVAAPVARLHWGFVAEHTAATANRFTLPLRIARLYAREPDRQLPTPVPSVQVKRVRDTWQAPRSGGRRHDGLDIFAPRGTAVYSATEGYVVRVGENRLGGNTVSVLGAGGRIYYYAHLDACAPDLAVGDAVTPDTVIGSVGTTGNARGTPPHLHFGVYGLAGAVNPLPLLTGR
jgi:peptidoglycan LD-endopeptidase LytH